MPPPEPLPEPDPIGDVERFVAGGPDQRWLKGRGPRALIQRAVRRVLQPYTTRQQQFERDVARSLRALQSRTDKRDV